MKSIEQAVASPVSPQITLSVPQETLRAFKTNGHVPTATPGASTLFASHAFAFDWTLQAWCCSTADVALYWFSFIGKASLNSGF